ncbi:MAG TPA: hypothetical protein DCE23_03820 [Firmicutes bacterium]|nr:hypothetical protein [Bacillota bacterium]
MRISYNQTKIKLNINKDIEYLKNKVSSILETAQEINIPSDFSRKSDILQTESILASAKSSLIKYSLWLDRLDSSLVKTEENNKSSIEKISQKEISQKEKFL